VSALRLRQDVDPTDHEIRVRGVRVEGLEDPRPGTVVLSKENPVTVSPAPKGAAASARSTMPSGAS